MNLDPFDPDVEDDDANLRVYRRTDLHAKRFRGTTAQGPEWSRVTRRVTKTLDGRETLEDVEVKGPMDRYLGPLPVNPDGRNERDIITELYYRGRDPRVEQDEEHFDGRDEMGPQALEIPEPKGVSAADMATHRITHLPFAPWCTTCIRARGRDGPHKTLDATRDERQELSRVEADYFFLGSSQGDDVETRTCLSLVRHTDGNHMVIHGSAQRRRRCIQH